MKIKYLSNLNYLRKSFAKQPRLFKQILNAVPTVCNANQYSQSYKETLPEDTSTKKEGENPIWDYFQNHKVGHGIWKWEHYFDIYHKHLAKFVGKKVDVLEIGIYSGGSLEMWRSYFGEKCHIYGVDIEEACKEYENDYVSVFIGDQESPDFWKGFKNDVKGIDILIDDGGHTAEQQQATLEEMLQHIRPGGVYICEDIHGTFNRFSAYAAGLVNELNSMGNSQFQSAIHSIHFYPYVLVIEKHAAKPKKLKAPKHGTIWQPFFDNTMNQ
ncbi:MAG TPA: class I SAM-dependent methyltransferase [Flavobacterium sp.]|uniref:class I SAM-dependent methyltransferase n=1 Tax=Flavobacterium sp. TaxID=239 RepID=UPI002C47081B|nr:class I SAM-dependent methyltransferase [Flavobacterium sp.]HNP33965.1 class I SAM-dependent methyltransferase [Flavobacterium sp.]